MNSWLRILFWFVGIPILLGGLFWLNLRPGFLPAQATFFATYWQETRAFLFENASPYENAASPTPGAFSIHPAYPLFATLFFAPFALIPDFAIAQAAWTTFLQLAALATLLTSLRLARWQPPAWLAVGWAIFIVAWFHGYMAIQNGDLIVLTGLFLSLSLLCIRAERYEIGGILLAFSCIHLPGVLLVMAFILIWCASKYKTGGVTLILYFLGTLALLSALGSFLQPAWLLGYLRLLLNTSAYPGPTSLGQVFFSWWPGVGRQLGWAISALLSAILLVEWLLTLRQEFTRFLWACCLTLAFSAWIGLPTSPMTFHLLILPLVVVCATWEGRHRQSGRVLAVVAPLIFGLGLWKIFWDAQSLALVSVPPQLFIPVPLVLFILLYWVRWWIIRPRRFLDAGQ
jgi:hypothetical protein